MAAITADEASLILDLFDIGAVKFGDFTLKSGIQSPVYFDLRVVVSYPRILAKIADALIAATAAVAHDILLGVPYTALPFATMMSAKTAKPMLMRRKEAKKYGTKKIIEGVFTAGQTCLIVEDLVTSGMSVFETIEPVEKLGMVVNDVVVLLDREQGGRTNIELGGKALHAVFTVSQILACLEEAGKLSSETVAKVQTFIAQNQVELRQKAKKPRLEEPAAPKRHTYAARAAVATANPMAKRLFELMDAKKTNLCCSADVTTSSELLTLARAVGPQICCLKTHCDIVTDWTADTAAQLRALAAEHNFVLFEDRKFADIGNTVKHQCQAGHYQIAHWADVVNAHPLPGPGVVEGLKEAASGSACKGLLLLAQMSSGGNMLTPDYTAATLQMALDHQDFVFGFICQERLRESANPDPFLYMTPGVKLAAGGDRLGQQYNTPHRVIVEQDCDLIIVGRGIYKADDPAASAVQYRDAGWAAYCAKTGQ